MVEEVSVDTDRLELFSHRGSVHLERLNQIEFRLRHLRLQAKAAGLDFTPPSVGGREAGARLRDLMTEVAAVNRFVTDLRTLLADRSMIAAAGTANFSSELTRAIGAGEVPVPTDRIRDDVVAAMVAGQDPQRLGMPSIYFPADYLTMHRLGIAIENLRRGRDEAAGSWWIPFDRDVERVAALDRRLVDLEGRRAEARQRLFGADGRLTEAEAVVAVGGWSGGGRWQGMRLAEQVIAYQDAHADSTVDGTVVLSGRGDRSDRNDFLVIASALATDEQSALGFYNTLGLDRTVNLATLIGGNFRGGAPEDQRIAFEGFGSALAAASRADLPTGAPALAFGGGELMSPPSAVTASTVVWHHPALLLASGEFATKFLTDATTVVLQQAHGNPKRSTDTLVGFPGHVYPGAQPIGEDVRNIVLARSAERSDVARLVVRRLAGDSSDLGALLRPERRYRPASPHHDWGFVPRLGSASPIVSFMIAAAEDNRSARIMLNSAAAQDRALADPGVVAGIDAVMGRYASIMFGDETLAAVGMAPSDLNVGAAETGHERAVTRTEWQQVHGRVLEAGRGQALAIQSHRLLQSAIAGSIVDGVFHHERVDAFATVAAVANAAATRAMITHAATLDEGAARTNRLINTSVGVGLGLAGAATYSGAGIIAGAAFSYYGAAFNLPTDNELRALRRSNQELRLAEADWDTRWQNVIYVNLLNEAATRGTMDLVPPGEGQTRTVVLSKTKELPPWFEWHHPETGQRQALPRVGSDEFDRLFHHTPTRTAILDSAAVSSDYMDGVLASAGSRHEVVKIRDRSDVDGGQGARQRVADAHAAVESLEIDQWLAIEHGGERSMD